MAIVAVMVALVLLVLVYRFAAFDAHAVRFHHLQGHKCMSMLAFVSALRYSNDTDAALKLTLTRPL